MLFQTLLFPGDPSVALPVYASNFLYFFLKAIFVLGALIFLVFAFVVTRQIHVMKSTVLTPQSGLMTLLGFIHLLLAFGLLLLYIVIL